MKARILLMFLCFSLCAMDNKKKDPHYDTYKKRFPQTRKSYKKYSNDHLLFLGHLEHEVAEFKKRAPEVFEKEVKIFTLGCHDGDISKSTVEIVQKLGAQNISFRAVDPYHEHVKETATKLGNFDFKEVFIEQEDLEQYTPEKDEQKTAHIILVEQVCHHIKNLEQFIQKIMQLAAPQSIILFGHTDDSASTLNSLFNKLIGGNKYITSNVCPKIKGVLKKSGHTFTKKTTTQKIDLPNVSDQTWSRLKSVQHDYKNDYTQWSKTDLEIKNILEFCATQPLEKLATPTPWYSPRKITLFLTALSTKLGKTIDLKYKIHTIYLNKK